MGSDIQSSNHLTQVCFSGFDYVGVSVAQSFRQVTFSYAVVHSVLAMVLREKSQSTLYRKSWVFLSTPVSSHGEVDWVGQDKYSWESKKLL